MNKVAEKMRSLGVADAADEIERLERINKRRNRAVIKLTEEIMGLRAWVLELQFDTKERRAIAFALDRLRGTLSGNDECDHADALAGLMLRTRNFV
jgi:hypothetical protein